MKKVLVTQAIPEEAVCLLRDQAEVVVSPDPSEEAILHLIKDANALIVRTTSRITRRIVDASEQLKVISRTGAGLDNIDVKAATERGIAVCHLPGVNSLAVAEHTVALILALAKQLRWMDRNVRKGNWGSRNADNTVELYGLTLGVVGLGQIGRRVAQQCRQGFGMKVKGHDPWAEPSALQASGVCLLGSIEPVFAESDFVSIHVPYNPQTHHLVDGRLLGLMRPQAYLVNTSRGGVVDEQALVDALRSRTIAGAGLDVMEEEPPSAASPLLGLPKHVFNRQPPGWPADENQR